MITRSCRFGDCFYWKLLLDVYSVCLTKTLSKCSNLWPYFGLLFTLQTIYTQQLYFSQVAVEVTLISFSILYHIASLPKERTCRRGRGGHTSFILPKTETARRRERGRRKSTESFCVHPANKLESRLLLRDWFVISFVISWSVCDQESDWVTMPPIDPRFMKAKRFPVHAAVILCQA